MYDFPSVLNINIGNSNNIDCLLVGIKAKTTDILKISWISKYKSRSWFLQQSFIIHAQICLLHFVHSYYLLHNNIASVCQPRVNLWLPNSHPSRLLRKNLIIRRKMHPNHTDVIALFWQFLRVITISIAQWSIFTFLFGKTQFIMPIFYFFFKIITK